jgi:alpha-tubulin suppressor-like RCC1 family protein
MICKRSPQFMQRLAIMKKTAHLIIAVLFNILFVTGAANAVNPQVAAGESHTVGLKDDGSVVAVGEEQNAVGQCNVVSWTDVVQVAAGGNNTAGLKADGTAVVVGANDYGQCNVGSWHDIVQVAAGSAIRSG